MSPRRTDVETGEPTWDINAAEVEAEARRRTTGLCDAEQRRRRQLAAELLVEMRRPLIDGNPPTSIERLAELATNPKPARHQGSKR